jgi:hypothetical protein
LIGNFLERTIRKTNKRGDNIKLQLAEGRRYRRRDKIVSKDRFGILSVESSGYTTKEFKLLYFSVY